MAQSGLLATFAIITIVLAVSFQSGVCIKNVLLSINLKRRKKSLENSALSNVKFLVILFYSSVRIEVL